jgi:hypothetical protein
MQQSNMRKSARSITMIMGVGAQLALLSWTAEGYADSTTGATDAAGATEQRDSDAALAVSLNLAGFGLFGPDLNIAYGSEFTGFVRARAFGLGYLSHSMFTPEAERKLSMGSFSVGLGGHKYFGNGSFEGPYVGVVAEYLMVEIEEELFLGTATTNTTFLVPALEGGYRTMLGPLLVGGGLQIGYALALSEKCEFAAGGCETEARQNTIYGQLALDVGVKF